uniref:Uncharacterized protein n=1 Tax=Anopheles funestus TaxID=62324 RepID=A0A4Y0BM35_ANOFN
MSNVLLVIDCVIRTWYKSFQRRLLFIQFASGFLYKMEFSRSMVVVFIVTLLACHCQGMGLKIVFESFEQNLGHDVVWDIFYSRLGNQQFNHVPMKLPTAGLCDFADYLCKNHPKYSNIFVNEPQEGECPIRKRDMYVFDMEFPTDAVPSVVLRHGLYKAIIRGYLHGKEVLRYTTIVKAMDI